MPSDDPLGEDAIERALVRRLEAHGWKVSVAWGSSHGVDIEARLGEEHLLIEVKGRGSRNAMRVNYFLAVITELLQRMDDRDATYAIALPDLPQFRRLWERFPPLARSRTGIAALFVDEDGEIRSVAGEASLFAP